MAPTLLQQLLKQLSRHTSAEAPANFWFLLNSLAMARTEMVAIKPDQLNGWVGPIDQARRAVITELVEQGYVDETNVNTNVNAVISHDTTTKPVTIDDLAQTLISLNTVEAAYLYTAKIFFNLTTQAKYQLCLNQPNFANLVWNWLDKLSLVDYDANCLNDCAKAFQDSPIATVFSLLLLKSNNLQSDWLQDEVAAIIAGQASIYFSHGQQSQPARNNLAGPDRKEASYHLNYLQPLALASNNLTYLNSVLYLADSMPIFTTATWNFLLPHYATLNPQLLCPQFISAIFNYTLYSTQSTAATRLEQTITDYFSQGPPGLHHFDIAQLAEASLDFKRLLLNLARCERIIFFGTAPTGGKAASQAEEIVSLIEAWSDEVHYGVAPGQVVHKSYNLAWQHHIVCKVTGRYTSTNPKPTFARVLELLPPSSITWSQELFQAVWDSCAAKQRGDFLDAFILAANGLTNQYADLKFGQVRFGAAQVKAVKAQLDKHSRPVSYRFIAWARALQPRYWSDTTALAQIYHVTNNKGLFILYAIATSHNSEIITETFNHLKDQLTWAHLALIKACTDLRSLPHFGGLVQQISTAGLTESSLTESSLSQDSPDQTNSDRQLELASYLLPELAGYYQDLD